MDEKSMILEQERLAREKKRKKHKKIKIAAGVIALLVVAGGIFYVVKGREMLAAAQNQGVEIVAKEGQTILYAQIVSIYGNEIAYVETQMAQADTTVETDKKDTTASSQSSGERPGRGERPSGGQMPEGFGGSFGSGEMPDFSGFGGGQMPEGFGGSFGGQMPEGSGSGRGQGGSGQSGRGQGGSSQRPEGSGSSQMPGGFGGNFGGGEMPGFSGFGGGQMPGNSGSVTGGLNTSEKITTYIPVGTEVITKLGTTTTFSRLAAGDYVALIMEEENGEQIIMSVYIVG